MRPEDQIRRVLRKPSVEAYEVVFDLLEENGWDPELVAVAADIMPWDVDADHRPSKELADAYARLLGELAKTDYPAAVLQLTRVGIHRHDYRSYGALVDAINTAWFARSDRPRRWLGSEPTWEKQLRYEQMTWVTGETNGDLESWEGVTDEFGHPTSRPWTTEFAPEWMDDIDSDGVYRTVYDENVGREDDLHDAQGLWRQVRQFQAGSEVECPYIGGDDGNDVTLEQTYHGEHPGKTCALCDQPIGEVHGHIYLGEMGGVVYQLDTLAGVTNIEIEERGHMQGGEMRFYWQVTFYADEQGEVTPAEWRAVDEYFETAEAADAAVRAFLPPGMYEQLAANNQIDLVPLIDDQDSES